MELEKEWGKIAEKSKGGWKNEVEKAAERMNIEKLKEECQTKQRGVVREKTKTKSIVTEVEQPEYQR